ncbi:hypothetical protein FB45DRAFT_941025, partial [Roridomyces roridus]
PQKILPGGPSSKSDFESVCSAEYPKTRNDRHSNVSISLANRLAAVGPLLQPVPGYRRAGAKFRSHFSLGRTTMHISPAELANTVGHVVEGRSFALASLIVILWEYLITASLFSCPLRLDAEVQHFWSGPWSISRVLFFCNRYFTPGLLIFRLLVDFMPGLFPSEVRCCCDWALRINFPLNMAALALFKVRILVLRLWYLFQAKRAAQYALLAVYILCTTGSATLLILMFPQIHSSLVDMPMKGLSFCTDVPPSSFFLVFVPSFVLHGILSLFMVIRIIHNVRTLKHIPFHKRFLRDGGFLYIVIFFSVSFSISAAIVGVSPTIGVVAMFSNFMLALLSICVSRVILQLSQLAQAYSIDPVSKVPALLLHTAMVDRVTWERKMGCLVFMPPQHEEELYEEIKDYYY